MRVGGGRVGGSGLLVDSEEENTTQKRLNQLAKQPHPTHTHTQANKYGTGQPGEHMMES